MTRLHILLLIAIFFASCANDNNGKSNSKIEKLETSRDSNSTEKTEDSLASSISEPFKVVDIDQLEFTSGGGQSVNQNDFCDTVNKGFFGTYFIIDSDLEDSNGRGAPIGSTIIVHSPGKMINWKSTDTTQTIWQIKLLTDVISVWDSVQVGLPKNEVIKFSEANNGLWVEHSKENYTSEFNNFIAEYMFQNDTLKELTVTRKCVERK